MNDCLHTHVSRWRSVGGNREPVMIWACVKCHARFVPLDTLLRENETHENASSTSRTQGQ